MAFLGSFCPSVYADIGDHAAEYEVGRKYKVPNKKASMYESVIWNLLIGNHTGANLTNGCLR